MKKKGGVKKKKVMLKYYDNKDFWIGGHLIFPYEQKIQQTPCLGFNTVLQIEHL